MRQTLAWAAPLGVIALVTGGAAWTAAASATPDLEDRTAAEVLALVAEADVDRLSGTVRTDADLGLPELPEGFELPGADPSAGASEDAPEDASADASAGADPAGVLTRLLSGENSLRVWIDEPGDRFRADLVDPVAGATVVRDGDAVSFWSATDPGTVTRVTPPADGGSGDAAGSGGRGSAGPEDLTPQAAAERFLAEADGSTETRVDDPTVVAGRDAYVLVADPRDDDTLVDRIVLAVDGETGLPLRFQVFAVDQRRPAFQTGFTDVEFAAPDGTVFDDAFPEGATVRDTEAGDLLDLPGLDGFDALPGSGEGRDHGAGPDAAHGEGVEVVGEGWSAVAVLDGPGTGAADGQDGTGTGESTGADGTAGAEGEAGVALEGLLEPVDGGQALRTALVSVLLTDDGRVLVGSVPVDRLAEIAAD
jgi:outer membrane lipoprotein-sorting protein